MTDLEALADDATRAAGLRLGARRHGDAAVADVLHYGAVEIDPQHLVVWVLLSGEPSSLPAWWDPTAHPEGRLAAGLERWLESLGDEVREEFARVGWPRPDGVTVLFDSLTRVEQAGGWTYFR